MKLKEAEPEFCVTKQLGIYLSGQDQANLTRAVIVKGGQFRIKARGFSMAPFIKDGDTVTISPLFFPSIAFGRSVAFIQPQTGRLIIHRVVGKSGDSYLMKGDNNSKPDGLISREKILGCVINVERNGKKVFLGLSLVRIIIAFFSRCSLLCPITFLLRRCMHPTRKRFKYE